MAMESGATPSPEIDTVIAEMGGEEAVATLIEETKRRVADGTLPEFHDRESFLEFFGRGRRSRSRTSDPTGCTVPDWSLSVPGDEAT
jgi:hypothetical protein